MKDFKTLLAAVLTVIFLAFLVWVTITLRKVERIATISDTDSTTIKKVLEKTPVESGQLIATVQGCKLYRLKIMSTEVKGRVSFGGFIYWSVCDSTSTSALLK